MSLLHKSQRLSFCVPGIMLHRAQGEPLVLAVIGEDIVRGLKGRYEGNKEEVEEGRVHTTEADKLSQTGP